MLKDTHPALNASLEAFSRAALDPSSGPLERYEAGKNAHAILLVALADAPAAEREELGVAVGQRMTELGLTCQPAAM